MLEVGKTYNARTLRRMRQLYLFFENQKWSPAGTKVSLSHIRELFVIKDSREIQYYVSLCIQNNLSRDELRSRIKSNKYKRLPLETIDKLFKEEKVVSKI